MLNYFLTGPPIITEHTLQASELGVSKAKLTVCITSSVYCIAHLLIGYFKVINKNYYINVTY